MKIEGRFSLSDDGAHSGAQQEGPQLVHHRGDGLLAFAFTESVKPGPERLESNLVGKRSNGLVTETRIGKQYWQRAERHAWPACQSEQGGVQDVLHARSPVLPVEVVEDRQHLIGD